MSEENNTGLPEWDEPEQQKKQKDQQKEQKQLEEKEQKRQQKKQQEEKEQQQQPPLELNDQDFKNMVETWSRVVLEITIKKIRRFIINSNFLDSFNPQSPLKDYLQYHGILTFMETLFPNPPMRLQHLDHSQAHQKNRLIQAIRSFLKMPSDPNTRSLHFPEQLLQMLNETMIYVETVL